MPQAYQYIDKDLMVQIHMCLQHRKALREEARMKEVLNDVIERGLAVYAREYGIHLPPRREEEQEGTLGRGRRKA